MSRYEDFPQPRGQYDVEFLEAIKYELEVALSMLDMESGLDELTSRGVDFESLQGEELDLAIEHLHQQVSGEPVKAAHLSGRQEELLRLKATVEGLLGSAHA